ncbi:MAG TPA: hypothetical protein PL155_02475 [Candidatus Omnitrophota bacterium]|nr:hypothetical protein [Candidatus Omnitrophota bacterium]HPD84649.1 hypothetical protein [Candidatus Omnitrophota bacterium]HRZ03507.1 hypothetical protein [Candidatus Omnitrophota bacterium]
MSKTGKLIIVILFVLIVASVFLCVSLLNDKTKLERTVSDKNKTIETYQASEKKLTEDNKKLDTQLQEAQSIQAKIKKQLDDINTQVVTLTGERDDWKGQVDQLRKERDDLMSKLQEKLQELAQLQQQAAVSKEVPEQPKEQAAGEQQAETIALPESLSNEKYWANVLKEKASLELKIEELQGKLSSGSTEVEELKKKSSDLELELGQLKNDKEEIERKIKYSEDLANSLSIELAKEKNDKRYIADRLDKFKEENLNLRAQVKELSAAKIALEKNITKLGEERDTVERKLSETESIIQNRIDEVLDIKKNLDQRIKTSASSSKEVELPPIIVSAPNPAAAVSQPSASAVGIEGRVVSINTENNFIVIDRGENAGVRIGDKLSVYRGTKFIASVEVIQVRKDICAADIKQKGAKIKAGDIVK